MARSIERTGARVDRAIDGKAQCVLNTALGAGGAPYNESGDAPRTKSLSIFPN